MTIQEMHDQLVAAVDNSKKLAVDKLYHDYLIAPDSSMSKRTMLGLDKKSSRKNTGMMFQDNSLF